MLIAFAVLNLGVGLAAEVYPRIRDPFYGDKLVKLRKQQQSNHGVPSVVMLGTSRTGFAFHGQRIEQRARESGVPITAFNYGIPASGPVTHLLYTQRLLRDGIRPDLLLIEFLPSQYADHRGGFETHWLNGDRLLHHELAIAGQFGFDANRLGREWRTTTLLPWYGLRFQLLGRVISSWIPWQIRYDWSRGTDAWGWGTPIRDEVSDEERTKFLGNAKAEYEPVLHDWHVNAPSLAALREILAVCRTHNIAVAVVMMPEGSHFRSWYPPEARQRVRAVLHELAGECRVIDAQKWLPDDAFYDDHHQFRQGAFAFSDRLTQEAVLPAIRGRNP